MEQSLDPYEEQLLRVFVSHDNDNVGSLDEIGLINLCETLQLEEKSNELVKTLLNEYKSRATFHEFKDALLKLLGTMQNTVSVDASPEREVSPKFVYGSKKYGRRSRPREELNFKDDRVDPNNKTSNVSVQRSNSQNEVTHLKKRKTNGLKRCTSFPGESKKSEMSILTSTLNFETNYTEDMLREAWRKLGVGKNGYLDQNELTLVCDAIGLNKLAESVIRRLSTKNLYDANKKISFQELLDTLKQDETWSEFFSYSNESELDSENFHNSKLKLGPDGNGFVSSDFIIEMWEQARIASPKSLLSDLGFKDEHINILELSMILDKEIKGLCDARIDYNCNPQVALLQAFLTLHQTEIRCLKSIMEQLNSEREKLKCDVYEANKRATLLAQEVDDNVSKMELNTQKQVKLIEQRHADLLKEAKLQFASDKEQLVLLNQNLEEKIRNLEGEELKMRDEITHTRKFSISIESENSELSNKIFGLEEMMVSLKEQIATLELEKLKWNELELENRDKLLANISELQLENVLLKDKHDEMVAKIENLSAEINMMRGKSYRVDENNCESINDNIPVFDGLGYGSKRSSPSQDLNTDEELGDGPCIGKIRKCKTSSVLSTTLESGYCESDLSGIEYDTKLLLERVKLLENLLKEHSIEIPSTFNEFLLSVTKPSEMYDDIESILEEIKREMKNFQNDDEKLYDILKKIILKQKSNNLENKAVKQAEEEEDLVSKCENLENCLGLLRIEYEKCEEYWQNKIDEERRLYEQEQLQNTQKLNELLLKLSDYEEQFIKDNRLPTIEESIFEMQLCDLQQELDELKKSTELALKEKEKEISNLKMKPSQASISIQVDLNKNSNLTINLIENMNLYSADTMPFNWNNNLDVGIDELTKSLPSGWKSNSPPAAVMDTSASEVDIPDNNSMPCRQKRSRYRDKNTFQNIFQKRSKNQKVENTTNNVGESSENKCWVPVDVLQELQNKKICLEERCRKLQYVLKQQHIYDEQILHYSWQQYIAEKAELQRYIRFYQDQIKQNVRLINEQQERLAKNDLLVKDLFVDNAYLMAENQRLEQKCHILANNYNTKSL